MRPTKGNKMARITDKQEIRTRYLSYRQNRQNLTITASMAYAYAVNDSYPCLTYGDMHHLRHVYRTHQALEKLPRCQVEPMQWRGRPWASRRISTPARGAWHKAWRSARCETQWGASAAIWSEAAIEILKGAQA